MATINPVKIGNMALSHVGVSSFIETLSEDSVEANQISLWYDFSREQALEMLDWNFARKRQTLATHSDDPPDGVWSYRYQYPADALKVRTLVNPAGKDADAIPFEIENSEDGSNKTILTDLDEAVVVYTFKLQDTSLFSPMFVEALSFLLAHHIAFALTGNPETKKELLQAYFSITRVAQAYIANEGQAAPPRDAEHVRVR